MNPPVTQQYRILLLATLLCLLTGTAWAQVDSNPSGLNLLNPIRDLTTPNNISTSLIVVFVITLLSLAPSILVMTTSFTRVIVVLGFLRQAMGTQQSPPNQVVISLALFLTLFVMYPTYQEVYNTAIIPYTNGQFVEKPGISPTDKPLSPQQQALTAAMKPIRGFMFRQVKPKDLALFIEIAKLPRPKTPDDVPTHVLIPAYITSEITIAFEIGFLIYIPFLIIDMVVASTLMAMGMMMLPPIMISLPFKIIMFVLADGWYLLLGSLARGFN